MIFFILAMNFTLGQFVQAQQQEDAYKIQWRDYTFYTNQPLPVMKEEMTIRAYQPMESGYYFVQFAGPITKAMKQQVTEANGTLLNYVPNNAYIVTMDQATRDRVAKLPVVQWVGIYQPGMRLSRKLQERIALPKREPKAPSHELRLEEKEPPAVPTVSDITLTILVFKGAELEKIKEAVLAGGGQVLYAEEGKRRSKLRVVVPPDKVFGLARVNGIMWIEEFTPYRLHNDMGRGVMDLTPVWTAHGLQGNGQIIAVADSGIDSGVNDATMHDDIEGRITNLFSWPVQNSNYCVPPGVCLPINVGADDGASDLDSGHGTHTTGSVLGNGTLSGGTYSGVAPQASLVFQALEQFVDLPLIGGSNYDGYTLGGIPANLNDLFQQAYDAGARIHSNSWGAPVGGEYTDNSQEVDEFVWDHPDMLILYSAGNAGSDGDTNSVVDTGSLGAPGTAKNALTVGASENNRGAIPLTWSWNYGANINADRIANNTSGMAAFSSRGPANSDTGSPADDRVKPDLVAPGTMVVSTRSQFTADTVWFTDDMEAGVGGWTAGGTWAQVTADSHSANTSWHDSPAGNYANNANISLTSPIQNLSGGGLGAKTIQFYARFDLGTGDEVRLEISNDGGTTWPLWMSITGPQADWELMSVGLDGFPDFYDSANFRLRFRLIADNDGNTGDGIFIDDVRIVEGAFNTARLSDFGLAAAGSADDQNYLLMNGTSMSTPLTAGAAALVRQYYTQELGLSYVSAALLRATLINGATDMSPGQYGMGATREMQEKPNNVEGWGRVNLENSLYPAAPAVLDHADELAGLETGETHEYQLNITDAGAPISITMVYHDYPSAALTNNLDMTVLTPGPGGTTEYPNRLVTTDDQNNVEQIIIAAPVVGTYTIRVHGQSVPEGPQPYALVTSAGGTLTRRDPVDVMLALDLSGSMLSPACPTGCDPKLDVLKDSVELFIALWTALTVPDDRIGVNYFRTNIDEFDVGGTVLLPVLPNADAIVSDVQGQTTVSTNLTAMGGSLQTAINRLTDATRPRNIILFTDGMQNVNPMVVDTDPAPAGIDLEIDDVPGRPNSGVIPTTPPTVLDTALAIKVNTIGVGATPAFTGLLNDIASETNGVSKLTTSPDNDLRRFYVEELMDALRNFSPQLLDYRYGNVSASGSTETFTVNGSARKVVLKLSWKRGKEFGFRVEKDGVDLTKHGKFIHGPYYRIFVFEPPRTINGTVINAAGDWHMHITGDAGATYEAAAIVDETKLKYEFSVVQQGYRVGDPLKLKVRLTSNGHPITDAQSVKAKILAPRKGIGNLLSETATPATPPGWQTEPEATPGQKKLLVLLENDNFFRGIQPLSRSLELTHKGGGNYEAAFDDTLTPGIYTAVFIVEGERPDIGKYNRTETFSTIVRFGKADRWATEFRIKQLEDPSGKWNTLLIIRPKDRHGNYLGPDYGDQIVVTLSPGEVSYVKRDLADGRYEIPLAVVPGTDPTVNIRVMGEPLFEGPLSDIAGLFKRFSFSLHVGSSIPTGSFNNDYDPSYSVSLDMDYHLTQQFSLVGILGYNDFDASSSSVDDTYWWNISANLKYELNTNPLRPYVIGGPGVYIPEHGSTRAGFNVGLGLDYSLSPSWTLELGGDYHHIFTSGSDTQFIVPHIGVIYRW